MGSDVNRLNVDGHTFWRNRPAVANRSSSRRRRGSSWTNRGSAGRFPHGRHEAEPVVSGSREVMRYMRSVVKTMQRATRRTQVRPAPKPVSKQRRVQVGDFVPCPLCQGEAWHDCEVCAGSGRSPSAASTSGRETAQSNRLGRRSVRKEQRLSSQVQQDLVQASQSPATRQSRRRLQQVTLES